MSYCPNCGCPLEEIKVVGALVYYSCPADYCPCEVIIYNPDRFPSPVYEMSAMALGEVQFIEYDEERGKYDGITD